MVLRVIGDVNFDGLIECQFINGDVVHSLKFDLDKWSSTQEHGIFGGNYFLTFRPKELKLLFDAEQEVEVDDAREVYSILSLNGWTT